MIEIRKKVNLAEYTTLKLGGPAGYFSIIRNAGDIKKALQFARAEKLKIFVLGGGSNILVPDVGIEGFVLKMEIRGISRRGNIISAGAGEKWDKVTGFAVKNNLSGIENLSLIPGTVGGAVYQNIGAYGAEIKDVVRRVLIFDVKNGTVRWLSGSRCLFGYRTSIFRKDTTRGFIILSAELELSLKFRPNLRYPDLERCFHGKKITLTAVRRAVVKIRKAKLPYPPALRRRLRRGEPQVANAGSFFKNPFVSKSQYQRLKSIYPDLKGRIENRVKLSAGQLIELAGWKGRKVGGVGVSERHALVLVNHGRGTAGQLESLVGKIQADVHGKFGVTIEPEVEILRQI